MIFLTPIIMYHIFWKGMCKDLGFDFMTPIIDMPMNYMVMCAK